MTHESRPGLSAMLRLVARASATHIGGTPTQSWLRTMLVDTGRVTADDFNRWFAVARLTPGTNLLAFYAVLGQHVARWRGALACIGVGTIISAAIAALLGICYVQFAGIAGVGRFMAGAQAAAVAVLAWTAVRLLVTTAAERPGRGAALAALALLVTWWDALTPIALLLGGAALGALWLRGDR
jgi:chromate transporter